MRFLRASIVASIVFSGMLLAGCASVQNLPINRPTADPQAGLPVGRATIASEDEFLVGLAFSGGGTRAAAFSFGVLGALGRPQTTGRGRTFTLIDHVDFVTGVSGGSVTAAYFGLKKRAALVDFRERFLIKDAEEALRTNVSLANLGRAFQGGINEEVPFRHWLDANLFEGATFAALREDRRPRVWINATDIYNRTPFIFGRTAFSAICSDLSEYPIAAAVAASAAVPVAFAPVVIETFPERCNARLPDWITRAMNNSAASPLLRSFALGIGRYRDGTVRYIKLLDGGLVDNYGLSGFTIARESAIAPYEPLSPAQAMRLRRGLFLVVDSGRGPQGDWTRTIEGPRGLELIVAATDAALDASVRASYAAFEATMKNWREDLIRWRCRQSLMEVQRLRRSVAGWSCRDLQVFVGRLSFDQLDPERAARLNQVPTRFRLPVETVDELIAAGGDAVLAHPAYRAFLGSF